MTVQSTPITHKYKWPTVSGGACIDMRVAGRSEPQRATIPRTTTRVRDPDAGRRCAGIRAKGLNGCHGGSLGLEGRSKFRSF